MTGTSLVQRANLDVNGCLCNLGVTFDTVHCDTNLAEHQTDDDRAPRSRDLLDTRLLIESRQRRSG